MDIIDIMLARAMTPQGQTETYVSIANAAAAKAEKAKQDAETAIASIEEAADNIAATQEAANDLLETAQDTLETVQAAQINIPDTEDIDDEVKKLTFDIDTIDGTSAKTVQFRATYPDNTLDTENVIKMYKATGSNEDGTMTQKAITDALSSKADSSSLSSYASITYVDNAINNIPATNATVNLGSENAGKMVVVDTDGSLRSGSLTEEALESLIVKSDSFVTEGVVGLTIDYENKSFERIQEASGKTLGNDFNHYSMYGGRMRCNVADDGTINAFYGDSGYKEDGSNGQVMIYQPKFYYQRIPIKLENGIVGKIIRKESLLISASPHAGFKIHPLFEAANGDILDYALLPAYDSCAYDVSASQYILDDAAEVDLNNDKLSSIANAKPISGANHSFTSANAEKLATNRGTGWHIEIIEFGRLNGQAMLENGITNIGSTPANTNCSALTGSTSSLGNASGHATSTTIEINGTNTTYSDSGKRAISYRGMENPWGNIWHFIGGVTINGNSAMGGGIPYICNDYNYTPSTLGENYISAGFSLPSNQNWISAMGYGSSTYDWVFMPAECADTATSATPVGDMIWTTTNLRGNRIVVLGGMWSSGVSSGPFYYGCDNSADSYYNSYSAKLMYIPTKNSIHNSNYQAWLAKFGA